MKIIDGNAIAARIKADIANKVTKLLDQDLRPPHLVAILVGDDEASKTYVAAKEKDCAQVGITSSIYRFPIDVREKEILDVVQFLNKDEEVDGFIVQLPLPKHIDVSRVISAIDPTKDVDGFHPVNLGRMLQNEPAYHPATPYGIMQLLDRSGIDVAGKHCVILGRSNIVGTPLAILLSRKSKPGNATVTICHSHSRNMEDITRTADVIVAAMGVPQFVKAYMLKKDVIVIDVGIHRVPSDEAPKGYKLVGDVDHDDVAAVCSMITPVPGGVGPMTRVGLLLNTLRAYNKEVYPITTTA